MSQAQETRVEVGEQVAKLPAEARAAYHDAYSAIFHAIRDANMIYDGAGHLAIAMIGATLELEVEQMEVATAGTDSVAGSLQ